MAGNNYADQRPASLIKESLSLFLSLFRETRIGRDEDFFEFRGRESISICTTLNWRFVRSFDGIWSFCSIFVFDEFSCIFRDRIVEMIFYIISNKFSIILWKIRSEEFDFTCYKNIEEWNDRWIFINRFSTKKKRWNSHIYTVKISEERKRKKREVIRNKYEIHLPAWPSWRGRRAINQFLRSRSPLVETGSRRFSSLETLASLETS